MALSCATALAYLLFVAAEIRAPYSLDYGEGVVWWQSVHIDDFTLVYKPLDRYPYMVTHYPPVYHWVVRGLTCLIPDWMVAGRFVSLLSALGIGLAVGLLVYRVAPDGSSRLNRLAPAFMAGTLALAVYPVFMWSRFARVDMLALLFAYAGTAVFILSKSERGQLAAFGLFVLAVYTKQTTVLAPLACLFAACLDQPKRALRLLGFSLFAGSIPLAWLMWATHGGFLLNTFAYNRNPWEWSRYLGFLRVQLLLAGPVLVLAAVPVAWTVWHALRGDSLRRLVTGDLSQRAITVLGLHALGAAISTLAAGKIGSSLNYFLELDITCCALGGLALAGGLAAGRRRIWALALPVQAILLVMAVSQVAGAANRIEVRRQHAADYASLLDAVRQDPGTVYVEDVSLVMRAGKEPPAESAIITALARAGVWDEKPFVERLEQGKFGTLVIEDLSKPNFYTPAVAAAVRRVYEPLASNSLGTIYRPRR